MRPKFEACRVVLVTVIPLLQAFLHGSNSTKMRIKESTPTMIRYVIINSLSQSNFQVEMNIGIRWDSIYFSLFYMLHSKSQTNNKILFLGN